MLHKRKEHENKLSSYGKTETDGQTWLFYLKWKHFRKNEKKKEN